MMRSLFSGVSGLQSHQLKMDVIGNNIANVNTTGFKSQRATFSDVFYQTTQTATGASDDTGLGGRNAMQVGLGSSVASIDTLMTTGSTQRTDRPFDLKINNDSFLIVEDIEGQYFTKDGALHVDIEGSLVLSSGMKVQGWPASADGTSIMKGQVGDLDLIKPSVATTPPAATTNVSVSGNLNLADSLVGYADDGTPIVDPIYNNIKFYDTLGNYYTLPITFSAVPAAGGGTVSQWALQIPVDKNPDGTETNPPQVTVTDANGNTFALGSNGTTFPTLTPADPGVIEFDTSGKTTSLPISVEGIDFKAFGVISDVGDSGNGGTNVVVIDISELTQYESPTDLDPKLGTPNGAGAGKKVGVLMDFDIGGDGIITAYYDNGDTRFLGQIATATFANPAGLEKVGGNLFASTNNSGEFDGIGSAGNFQAGALEMSNVDLSKEFVEMITTQRGFQANSKTITTSDEMIQELLGLKR